MKLRQAWVHRYYRNSKKSKGKEKVPKPREELPKHVDFHSFFKSNGDGDSLLVLPLNKQGKGKGGQTCLGMSTRGQDSRGTRGGNEPNKGG